MATTPKEITIDASSIYRNVEVRIRVEGIDKLRFRLWIGLQFVRFGVWLSGLGCRWDGIENE